MSSAARVTSCWIGLSRNLLKLTAKLGVAIFKNPQTSFGVDRELSPFLFCVFPRIAVLYFIFSLNCTNARLQLWNYWERLDFRIKTSLILISFLIPFDVYIRYRASSATSELAGYVAPYPSMRQVAFQHFAVGHSRRTWIFESDDAPQAVLKFYENQDLQGWNVQRWTRQRNVDIKLFKDELKMRITASRPNGQTTIVYMLDTQNVR